MLGVVYKSFPNGLTPDESSIVQSLKKFATKSSNAWVYNPNSLESKEATLHTLYISKLAKIGKKLGFDIFIGKREQQEKIDSKKLKDFASVNELDFIKDTFVKERASYIDILFIRDDIICYAFEIENYVWAEDKKTGLMINKPIDDFNHLMDALRYATDDISKATFRWNDPTVDALTGLRVVKM